MGENNNDNDNSNNDNINNYSNDNSNNNNINNNQTNNMEININIINSNHNNNINNNNNSNTNIDIYNDNINNDSNNNNNINNNNNNNNNNENYIFNNSGREFNYFIFPIDENGDIYKKEKSNISIEMKPNHVILGTDRNLILKDKITLYTDANNLIQTSYPHQFSHFVGQYQFEQIIQKINNLSSHSNVIYKRLMIASLVLSVIVFVFGIVLHFYSKRDGVAIQVETIIIFIIGIILIIIFSAIPVIRNNKRAQHIKKYLKELNQLFKEDGVKFKGEFDEVSKCSDRQSTKQLRCITIEYPLYSNNNHGFQL